MTDTGPTADTEPTCQEAVAQVQAILRQTATAIRVMRDDAYAGRHPACQGSGIGAHLRHCLDHSAALCTGFPVGEVDYETRQRGTDIESSRAAGLLAIEHNIAALASLAAYASDHHLTVLLLLSGQATARRFTSTLGRELAFVLSHTIHHQAMMQALATQMGIAMPKRFGYAPATIAYLDQSACSGGSSSCAP